MKLFYLILTCAFFFTACDDPSLDRPAPDPDLVEPIDDSILLSQIQISDPVTEDVLTDISLSYDDKNRAETITFAGNTNLIYSFEYAANNRLISFTRMENGATIEYQLEYFENTIEINYSEGSNDFRRIFSIDRQNRISQSIIEVNDVIQKDVFYQYTANFNVERINNRNALRNITSYSLLTYEFNNNPFRDMNDIITFIAFEDFVSYTRYLPTNQENYVNNASGTTLESTKTYVYELLPNNFPNSRTVSTDTGGTILSTLESFSYLEN